LSYFALNLAIFGGFCRFGRFLWQFLGAIACVH